MPTALSCLAGLRQLTAAVPLALLALFATPLIVAELAAQVSAAAKAAAPVDFNVPAGEASATLKVFSEQSGQTVVYLVDVVRGERTAAVKGRFTPREHPHQC